jgi:hypothetical protein
VVLIALGYLARPAMADGLCVTIDATRDSLFPQERAAVREAVFSALEKEGVAVDRLGTRCTGWVTLWNIRLGKEVTTTMVSGDRRVSGTASSIDELDLSISQLTRSLITGRSLATGFGVTDRTNVLRDQTAPRRTPGFSGRRWDPVFAVGGGALQLPAAGGKPRHRQWNIVALESRWWGFTADERTAFELLGRIVMHDWDVYGITWDHFEGVDQEEHPEEQVGRSFEVMMSPLAACNWEFGLGMVYFLGSAAPRPYLRAGATMGLLNKFSDDEHYIDLGLGGFLGLGFQLHDNVLLGAAVHVSNPLIHDVIESGYWYFATGTVMLEIKGKGTLSGHQLGLPETEPEIRTIRQINE